MLVRIMMFNVTFNNISVTTISLRSVFLVEETGDFGKHELYFVNNIHVSMIVESLNVHFYFSRFLMFIKSISDHDYDL
jgi:hypothetical protein